MPRQLSSADSGPPLVLVGALAHKLYFGAQSAPIWILVGLVLLAAVSLVLDSVASSVGAKKLGATWRGMVGAVVGGLIGLFFGLPGVILGPFIGAMALEMVSGRRFEHSVRAGAGAVLGLIAGALGKFVLCIVMIGMFCGVFTGLVPRSRRAAAHGTAFLDSADRCVSAAPVASGNKLHLGASRWADYPRHMLLLLSSARTPYAGSETMITR
jgi:uncharacterized protein YqgC (DUF456 family)